MIAAPADRVLKAFFDADALGAWWQVAHSVTTPRAFGPYAVEWAPTDFRDEILGRLGGAGVAHLRFSALTAFAPAAGAWIYGSEGTLRIEPGAKRISGGRRGDKALAEITIPPAQRVGWRVEEEFVNAIRGREKISHTTFEDGVRYMEFTDAVAKSAASGQAVEVSSL